MDRFVVIRSGLQLDHYRNAGRQRESVRSRYGFGDADIVAGVISRIAPLKGHEYIIELAKQSKEIGLNIKYMLIGDGESGALIKSEISKYKLEHYVLCSGMVSPDEIPGMISSVDFIIHPSLREGLARVLPQSIIMNKKVVTFDLDGVDEVITNGVSGYSIETGNVDALFTACRTMVTEEVSKKIDESFRKRVETEFSSETMVDQHVALYLELARR
jgi:glycosyltransferase involved in cell wall biosynthesis